MKIEALWGLHSEKNSHSKAYSAIGLPLTPIQMILSHECVFGPGIPGDEEMGEGSLDDTAGISPSITLPSSDSIRHTEF